MDAENPFPLSFPDSQLDFNAIPFGFDHDGFRHNASSLFDEFSLFSFSSGEDLLGGPHDSLREKIDDQDEKKSEIK
jgi:hypothetical protein